ncbi:hypothetical protein MMC11_003912 [Xylographa trunciseda]|nr:hypothetical protein [Xylographa trunciseda]
MPTRDLAILPVPDDPPRFEEDQVCPTVITDHIDRFSSFTGTCKTLVQAYGGLDDSSLAGLWSSPLRFQMLAFADFTLKVIKGPFCFRDLVLKARIVIDDDASCGFRQV